MDRLFLVLVGALVVAAIAFGVAALITGSDPGLSPAEPEDRAMPLPLTRPLVEPDVSAVRFETALRGYRMVQVDAALRRIAYDIGYKQELIAVLEAEVAALRDGRVDEADMLRQARVAALSADQGSNDTGAVAGGTPQPGETQPAGSVSPSAAEEQFFVSGDLVVEPEEAVSDQDLTARHIAALAQDHDAQPRRDGVQDQDAAPAPSPVGSGPRLIKNPGSTA